MVRFVVEIGDVDATTCQLCSFSPWQPRSFHVVFLQARPPHDACSRENAVAVFCLCRYDQRAWGARSKRCQLCPCGPVVGFLAQISGLFREAVISFAKSLRWPSAVFIDFFDSSDE